MTKTKKKTKKKASKAQNKKPKWTLTSYKQIEKAREQLGLSKSSMAEALEVTNSTYHNWRRGTTVPHPNQQEQIAARLRVLDSPTGKGTDLKSAISGRKSMAKSGRANGAVPHSRGTSPQGSGESGGDNTLQHNDSLQAKLMPVPLLLTGDVPRTRAIAAITCAWLGSQKKAPSAGSTISFIRELHKAFPRGT